VQTPLSELTFAPPYQSAIETTQAARFSLRVAGFDSSREQEMGGSPLSVARPPAACGALPASQAPVPFPASNAPERLHRTIPEAVASPVDAIQPT